MQPLSGCRSCDAYLEGGDSNLPFIMDGSIDFKGSTVEWELVESRSKAAGQHYIFTTTNCHIGPEEIEIRAALNAEVTLVAYKVLGENYRLINNSGERASSMDHYHVHLIVPEEGERLPRAVANVGNVIDNSDLLESQKDDLRSKLLQKGNI